MLRYKDEAIEDYAMRLFKNKNIYNLTNNEIANLLNNETGGNYSEGKYRKYYTPFLDGYDKAIKDNADLEKYEEMMDELYKQQVRTRDKLREYRKVQMKEARSENLQEVLKEVIEKKEEKEYTLPRLDFNKKERTGVIQLSDWHFGMIVDNFLNKSDKEIFDRKIEELIRQVIEYSIQSEVEELIVLNQGDLISGNIHVTTRVMNDEDAIEQTIYVAETLKRIITIIQKSLNIKIRYYSVTDNHSRINKNFKDNIEKENFNKIIDWYLENHFKDNENIRIMKNVINGKIEDEIGKFDIYGEDFLFIHGHRDKIKKVLQELPLLTRTFPLAIFTAHLHRNYEDEENGIDLIMNPSFIGVDEYAKSIRKLSKPRQKLTIYEKTKRGVERINTFFINL